MTLNRSLASVNTPEAVIPPAIVQTPPTPVGAVTDSKLKRLLHFLLRWETLLVIAILAIAGTAHGINMFHFPYFEDDEGTYLSQAWAVVNQGRLAYYTYWYDHAPVGWFQIALWTLLTGGFHTFDSPLYSGRVLMLIMQIGATWMLYAIARKISGNVLVALVVALLFALSPYGIYYHRRVLLDNITTFTMLLSILLLVSKRLSLKRVWLSALAFSIAVLSKEITVFITPALLYLVFSQTDKSHRWLATLGWIVLFASLVSLYPLMAIINNELFPSGTWLGGNAPHVSLLQGVLYQASRGHDGGILNLNSEFWIMTRYWLQDDPVLVFFGTCAAILSVLLIKKYRVVGIMGLCSLCFWLYFLHGGEVIVFYLVPLLPLLALNLGLVLGILAENMGNFLQRVFSLQAKFTRVLQSAIFLLCLMAIVIPLYSPAFNLGYRSSDVGDRNNPFIDWNGTQADAQMMAIQWVEEHIPANSRIVIDQSMWPDLHDSGHKYVHYYWKVETDPAIRNAIFHNNWRNIDYVITSPQMTIDAKESDMRLVQSIIDHSTIVVSFDTGGWPMRVRKVNK